MSTEIVPKHRWRLALWALTLTLVMGTALLVVLAFGTADPSRAGVLVWQTDSAEDWPPAQSTDGLDFYLAPIRLPQPAFTLEVTAGNFGDAASAWGVWLEGSERDYAFLVSREGYMSVSGDGALHWAEFMHIRSDINRIYLDVRADFSATLRINDEISWTGAITISGYSSWGIVQYQGPLMSWQSIALYAP